jgi:uncharacterized protein (TIGR03437 family)
MEMRDFSKGAGLFAAFVLGLLAGQAATAQTTTAITVSFPNVTFSVDTTTYAATFSGTGTVSPFGAATFQLSSTGFGFTLSNGDHFDFLLNGVPDFSSSGTSVTLSGTITGGTGQFAGATGNLSLTLTVNSASASGSVESGSFSLSGSGNITTMPASPNQLKVAPSGLSFSMQQGGAASAPQSISVFATAATPFTVSASGGSWLTVTPASGKTPGAVTVSVNPPTAAGTYNGSVMVGATNTTPASLTVPVMLVVTPASPPQLSVQPPFVNVSSVVSGPAVRQQVAVSNTGSGTLSFTAQAMGNAAWLSLSTTSGTAAAGAPAAAAFTVDPSSLTAGTYTAGIQIVAGSQSQTVTVTLAVSGLGQVIQLTQQGVGFTAVAQGLPPSSQDFAVLNTGTGQLNWSASVSTFGGGSGWLQATPAGGVSTAGSATLQLVTVTVNPAMLTCNSGACPAGQYFGTIQIVAPGAANSPQSVSVMLNLLAAGQTPPPLALPSGVTLVGPAGGANPTPQNITLTNLGAAAVTFASTVSTQDGQNWLTQTPAAGSVASGAAVPVSLQANTSGLAAGIRQGTLRIAFSDGTVREISVFLVVASSASGGSAIKAAVGRAASGGCAGVLAVAPQGDVSPNASLVALSAARLRVKVTDCGSGGDVNDGSVLATFDNSDTPVNLISRQGGTWEGTWTPSSHAAAVKVQLNAFSERGTSLSAGYLTFGVTITPNPNTLAARPGGIFNSASYQATQQISPGSWASVFGEQMADAQQITGTVPYPLTLQNTQVLLGGQPLPLYFVSATQVNALIPRGLAANTHQQLQVIRHASTPSVPVDVTVADLQPGIYASNQKGTGQGAVLIANTALLAGPDPGDGTARPVKRGDYISIYCTGLGPVSNAPMDGAPAPSSPLAQTINAPQVSIGGVPAPALVFSGLAPTLVGLYQINVQVPDGAPTGDAVSLVVSVGPAMSNVVTIAVQ